MLPKHFASPHVKLLLHCPVRRPHCVAEWDDLKTNDKAVVNDCGHLHRFVCLCRYTDIYQYNLPPPSVYNIRIVQDAKLSMKLTIRPAAKSADMFARHNSDADWHICRYMGTVECNVPLNTNVGYFFRLKFYEWLNHQYQSTEGQQLVSRPEQRFSTMSGQVQR